MERIKRFRIFPTLILAHSIFCGCTVRPTIQETIPDNNNSKSHKLAQNRNSIPEYRLGFSDVIEIKFFRNPRFNETVTIRPDGRISLEKIGLRMIDLIKSHKETRLNQWECCFPDIRDISKLTCLISFKKNESHFLSSSYVSNFGLHSEHS